MNPPEKKTIAVFGATGAQGGAVASIFLDDPKLKSGWAVRAVTRDPEREAAQLLAKRGAEVVAADLNDLSSLVRVLQGCAAVFGVTNYWEKANADIEVQQGRNLANAVKETGVQYYIWSSLLNVAELTNGRLPNVFHFDSKAKVEEYVRELGIPAAFFMAGFYMTGIPGELLKPFPPNGVWTLAMPVKPDTPIPMFHPRDTGKFVKSMILNWDKVAGKRILGATDYMTAQEVLDTFAGVFKKAGATAAYFQVPEEVFRGTLKGQGMPDYVVSELYENARLMEEYGYYGGASLDESKNLIQDRLTTWEEYVQEAGPFRGLA
ncbi:NmrA-like family protein [Xylaria palmicola]|nr:NmrA-like family protein [Xylaria palmicola]